jgi:carbamate kinase
MLFNNGVLVIASGGGGVPVIQNGDGTIKGVEGVIDKDRASVLMAQTINADILLTLTDVKNVYKNYGRPGQTPLSKLSIAEARSLADEGQFGEGSMGPKVESAIKFVESGGSRAIITSIENARKALDGKGGTIVSEAN